MRKGLVVLMATLALVGMVGASQATTVTSLFFNAELNLASDNSAEFLFDITQPAGAPSSQVDVGDVLITVFSMATLEDLTGGGTSRDLSDYGVEMSGISAIEVIGKVAVPNGSTVFIFGPVSAGARAAIAANGTLPNLAAELASWAPGTMIAVYDDQTPDYSRTNAGFDDGQPPAGADIGVGPFADEDALATLAMDGTRILELGVDGGANEFWVASQVPVGLGASDDIATIYNLTQNTQGGQVNFALDVVVNNTSWTYVPIPVDNVVLGGQTQAQFSGLGSLLGIGGGPYKLLGANTPFDAFDNVDVSFYPVPEPGSMLIWLGLSAVLGVSVIRRRG